MDNLSGSPTFLEDLLDQMMQIPMPILSPEPEVVAQDSLLLRLPDHVLRTIVECIPLKERILNVASTCKRLRGIVKASITSVQFYKEELDCLKDNNLNYFLSVYGKNIKSLNFDLFRSSYIEQCTQWAWRQSVVSCVSLCPQLEKLSILVCNRHRLRDSDLTVIFKHVKSLKSLSIDAHFIRGHCFQHAPKSLEKMELELCSRISADMFKNIYYLRSLKTLSLSQALHINNAVIYKIATCMPQLEDLALIIHGEHVFPELTAIGLSKLGRLEKLEHLAVEGIPVVTDRFLAELSNGKPVKQKLKSLSLAFCNNFTSVGLEKLADYPRLEDLNLDGCTRTDISKGLKAIARQGRLNRLLAAETCNISAAFLPQIIDSSPNLCLLDITGSGNAIPYETAVSLVNNRRESTPSTELIIMTDQHMPWNVIQKDEALMMKVVHVVPSLVPAHEFFSNSILSLDTPGQRDLSARLRRGNRCRLLCSALGMEHQFSDDKENSPSPLSPDRPVQVPSMFSNLSPPLGSLDNFTDHVSPLYLNKDSQESLLDPFGLDLASYDALFNQQFINSMLLADSFDSSLLPTVSRKSTGGLAPRPPIEVPQMTTIHHSRGSRSKKRRSVGAGSTATTLRRFNTEPVGPRFTESDFPPLGSS